MSRPESDVWLFQPLTPQWVQTITQDRWFDFYGEYRSLAERYDDGSGKIYKGENVTLDEVNYILDLPGGGGQHYAGPWVSQAASDGVPLNPSYWYIADGEPTEGQMYFYGQCAAWGLVCWQMQSVMIAEQINKLGVFGLYGRKPKEDR